MMNQEEMRHVPVNDEDEDEQVGGLVEHQIDHTMSPFEHFQILRTHLSAYKNDYVNRELRIGATVISAERATKPEHKAGWAKRNLQYHTELNAFSDHILSIKNMMAEVWGQLKPWQRWYFKALNFVTGKGRY